VAQLQMMGLLGEEDITVLEACNQTTNGETTISDALQCVRKEHARRAYRYGLYEQSVLMLSTVINKLVQSVHLADEGVKIGEPVGEFMLVFDDGDGKIITAPINMSEAEIKDYAIMSFGIKVDRVRRIEYLVTSKEAVEYVATH